MRSVTIAHDTTYQYRTEVRLGPHRLMLRPRETRDLGLTSFALDIRPEARIDWSHDVSGNAVATAQFDSQTKQLSMRPLFPSPVLPTHGAIPAPWHSGNMRMRHGG